MAFPLALLFAAAGAAVILSGKKKKSGVAESAPDDKQFKRISSLLSEGPGPKGVPVPMQYGIRSSPVGSGPKPEDSGTDPGPENCPFGYSVNRDGTACEPTRLAPGWAPLHGTFSKRTDGSWAGPLDVVYSYSTPSLKSGNQYTTGERYFLVTVADGYGLKDILSEKPKNWSSRTKRIIKLVANHPANHDVLRRNSKNLDFKWKIGKGKDGYTIKNLDPKKVWHDAPENMEQRLKPGESYGYIHLPAE